MVQDNYGGLTGAKWVHFTSSQHWWM